MSLSAGKGIGLNASGHGDGSVAWLQRFVGHSSRFSVVGVVDSCGLGVSDVDFYEKVIELGAYESPKVAINQGSDS